MLPERRGAYCQKPGIESPPKKDFLLPPLPTRLWFNVAVHLDSGVLRSSQSHLVLLQASFCSCISTFGGGRAQTQWEGPLNWGRGRHHLEQAGIHPAQMTARRL